ncbi:hypothetical protein [Nonomuraea sp. SBT364]|uniref:hypothetical protein n=1 Tax=Nonomuraea sp. SBT364 TaxID=1580530 RepID=UPI00066A6403|nr:hypothetical protein [Nonomuraea sp. SBT364]
MTGRAGVSPGQGIGLADTSSGQGIGLADASSGDATGCDDGSGGSPGSGAGRAARFEVGAGPFGVARPACGAAWPFAGADVPAHAEQPGIAPAAAPFGAGGVVPAVPLDDRALPYGDPGVLPVAEPFGEVGVVPAAVPFGEPGVALAGGPLGGSGAALYGGPASQFAAPLGEPGITVPSGVVVLGGWAWWAPAGGASWGSGGRPWGESGVHRGWCAPFDWDAWMGGPEVRGSPVSGPAPCGVAPDMGPVLTDADDPPPNACPASPAPGDAPP